MNQLVSEQTLELLDRKYKFVLDSSLETFMLDLGEFLKFLTQDEFIKHFTAKLSKSLEEKNHQYSDQLRSEKQIAIEIKDELLKIHPELDDSDKPLPGPMNDPFEYEESFANFNGIINKRGQINHHSLFPDPLDDNTDEARLIRILRNKIDGYRIWDEGTKKKIREVDTNVEYKLIDLEARHKFTHLGWLNYCRVSPGVGLLRLQQIIKRINPEPEDEAEWRKLSPLDKLNQATNTYLIERHYSWIQDAVYGVLSKYANHRPNNLSNEKLEEIFESQKHDLKRVYEAIRQEIGITRLHLQLLDRYRTRCQWYNQPHLRQQVVTKNNRFVPNREDVLTRDLALYLFDQGITVIYRPRFGKHEIDLVELDAKHPMFIEAKAYKDSSAKAELLSGIGQLHSYLCNYEAHKEIVEAYYVIFRIGGPIYEFQRIVQTNRFRIYPVLIDLGLSSESGRKQKKPIIISEAEILDSIKKESKR